MSASPYVYESPHGDRLAAALTLIFAEVDADERRRQIEIALARSASGDPLPGLAAANAGGRVVGAVWAAPQPGRTATLWAPQAAEPQFSDCFDELLRQALDGLTGNDVQLVHALLPCNAPASESLLRQHGFEFGATLYYMTSLRADFPMQPPQSDLEFLPYDVTQYARFAKIVEATYEGSLDCPQLDGRRHIDDVLAGYKANGRFDPQLWQLVRRADRDVGVLLLCDWPGAGYYELVYMGVIPGERGRESGAAIVRQAQWLTRQADRSHLLLAVDATNGPALKMYERAGFACWDRRQAFLKYLGQGEASEPSYLPSPAEPTQ